MSTRPAPHHDDLAARGAARIDWIRSRMPLLADVRARFADQRPFEGHRIGMSLHLEPKTAVLLETLQAGGAEIVATGNHGSTQDDIVAHLRGEGMTVFGSRADTLEQHHANVAAVDAARPSILLDNGADLAALAAVRVDADAVAAGDSTGGTGIIGGTEETTSGGMRLRTELAGRIPFPLIVINDSLLKAIGENKHSVGQSVVESIMRITNLRIAGRRFLVAGYGWCGRGIAQYLRAMGGKVAVSEVDDLKAFEAAWDGYRVGGIVDLASWAEVVITATGHPDVVTHEVIDALSDGTVLANAVGDRRSRSLRAGNGSHDARRGDRAHRLARRPTRRAARRGAHDEPRGPRAQGQLDRGYGSRLLAAGPLARTGRARRSLAHAQRAAGARRHRA